jgi:broad specificity phosphatase PhoE
LRRAVDQAVGEARDKRVLLVGHGGIFMMGVRALVEGLNAETLERGYQQCSLSEIRLEPGARYGLLERWNDYHYLSGFALEPTPKPAWLVSPAS